MQKDFIIRLKQPKDFWEVENLTREAFWNVYGKGCVEHYVLHQFRNSSDFIPQLDFVFGKRRDFDWTHYVCKSIYLNKRQQKSGDFHLWTTQHFAKISTQRLWLNFVKLLYATSQTNGRTRFGNLWEH